MGCRPLHPVRQVRIGLPAQRDPRARFQHRSGQRCAADLQARAGEEQGFACRHPHQLPGGAGRLHRLWRLRRGLPDPRQVQRQPPGGEHGAGRSAARPGARQPRLLPAPARIRPQRDQARHHPRRHAARSAVRVFRRLRRLRRNALHPARNTTVRRPHADRQRHRLLVDLRRQPADHALHGERRRPRPGLEQFAVRGQRRVRPRHAARCRPADGVCETTGAGTGHRNRR